MEFTVKKGMIAEYATEALVVPYCEDDQRLNAGALVLDKKMGGLITAVIAAGDFEGKLNQTSVVYTQDAIPARRIVLLGMGKRGELDREKLRGAFAKVAQEIRGLNVKTFAIARNQDVAALSDGEATEDLVEGVYLGLYQFTPFKTLERDKIKEIKEIVILEEKEEKVSAVKVAVKTAEKICHAVCFARDLVSTPANEMTPSDLAREAETMAATRKKVQVQIIDCQKMKELGMNALLAVASGSCQPPQFIVLEYRGGRKGQAPVVLVGKGLTFDSGGISIKPSEKMDEMKTDMAGGAAVIGAIMAACDLQLPINVVGLVPATENLPGGKAYKPGDVLKSLSGQTIEVLNTDAEGRIILADALTYAGNFKPAAIIDIATLTGACVIALGDNVSALFGTDDKLKADIKAAAESTGERVWELPFWDEYHEMIKSDVADYKNAAGRAAGTITAAAFLSKFVGPYPWVHLDIAGPSLLAKDKGYIPKGASGVGVRLFVRYLRNLAQSEVRKH